MGKYKKVYSAAKFRKDLDKLSLKDQIKYFHDALKNLRARDPYVRSTTAGTMEESARIYFRRFKSSDEFKLVERIMLVGLHSNEPFYMHTKDPSKVSSFAYERGSLKMKQYIGQKERGDFMWKDWAIKNIKEKKYWSDVTGTKRNSKILEMQTKLRGKKGVSDKTISMFNDAQVYEQHYSTFREQLEKAIAFIDKWADSDLYIGGSPDQYDSDEVSSMDVINNFLKIIKGINAKVEYLRDIVKGTAYEKGLSDLETKLNDFYNEAESFRQERANTDKTQSQIGSDLITPEQLDIWKTQLKGIAISHSEAEGKIMDNLTKLYEKEINSKG